jgi:hypothetical protein
MQVTIRRCAYRLSAIQAARVAAALREDPSLTVELAAGHYGEFTVLVDGREVLSAGAIAMLGIRPSIQLVREAVDRSRPSAPLAAP